MAKKNRIPLSPEDPVRLNNPFASLQAEGLPAPPPDMEPPPAPSKSKLGRVVLRRETAHRGGKMVIVVDDFAYFIPLAKIEDLARKLRQACGCGGTTRGRSIELQGNHAARIRALLEEEGFKVAGVS